jgi:DNA-directed RNA polymerase delta subunit
MRNIDKLIEVAKKELEKNKYLYLEDIINSLIKLKTTSNNNEVHKICSGVTYLLLDDQKLRESILGNKIKKVIEDYYK